MGSTTYPSFDAMIAGVDLNVTKVVLGGIMSPSAQGRCRVKEVGVRAIAEIL
jgi:hypothetical protein